MNYFLDLVYNLVMSPRMALRTITRGEQWISAGIIWLFTLFLLSLSSLIEGTGIILGFLLSLIAGITLLLLFIMLLDWPAEGELPGALRPGLWQIPFLWHLAFLLP